MKKETKLKVLPRPEVIRKPCHENCNGCERVFENYALPEGTILVDVCMAYEDPDSKWRNYRIEKETKTVKGKEVEVLYHYNPCALATHIEHSPKPEEKSRVRVKRK